MVGTKRNTQISEMASDLKSSKELVLEESEDTSVKYLRDILGGDVSVEKIKHFLLGADNKIDVALNHLLNDLEKERSEKRVSNNTGTINRTEKLLYELAEEVKCPLCLGYFNNPLILSCYHTFCSSCIEDLVTSENKVQCPLCRVSIELDDRGVRGLKPNYYLANIVEKLKSAQTTKMCDECHSNLCTVVCKQCKAFLCVNCNDKIHSIRLLYNHHRIPFEECFFTSNRTPPEIGVELDVNWETDCVIPFNVKKEVCTDLFHSWVKELWFAPSDLARNAILQDFKMVYIPCWIFDVDTTSRYVIGISDKLLGESSEFGVHSQRHSDVLILAANCKESLLLDYIEPWKVDQMTSFTLQHAEGAEVRPFALDAEAAWRVKAREKVDQLSKEACRKKVRHVRSDSVSRMHFDTTFSNKKSKRLFVPIYSTTYEYRGRSYLFIVNGSTAKAHGHRPYSISKMGTMGLSGVGAAIGLLSVKFKS